MNIKNIFCKNYAFITRISNLILSVLWILKIISDIFLNILQY